MPKSRVALYLRVSKAVDGKQESTSRQQKDAKAFAKIKGWEIVRTFEDVDISAYKEGVDRPAYEQLLAALRDGELDGLLVWKLDRLVRRTIEFERFWKACSAHDAFLASVNESIDSSTEIGMLVVRILVAFAQMESANTSLRLKTMERHKAQDGKPKISGRRAYGLSRDWSVVVEAEAAIVREAADRLLAGDSLRQVCMDFNARGVATVAGSARGWQPPTLRSMLSAPRMWGMREHKGDIVAEGSWPRLLTPETGERLRVLFDRPGVSNGRRTALLSGLVRCGECGGGLRSGGTSKGPRYVCPTPPAGCAAVVVHRGHVDRVVTDAVLYALDSPAMQKALRARKGKADDDTATIAALSAARRRQKELALMWAGGEGELSRTPYLVAQRSLDDQVAALERKLAASVDRAPARAIVGSSSSIVKAWGDLSVDRRRAVIDAVIERVVVKRAGKAGGRFNPDRLEIVWRA